MRRTLALAPLAVRGRITAARFDGDWQAHFLDRSEEIALHVMGKRLEGGHVQSMQSVGRLRPAEPGRGKVCQRRQEPAQCLARPRVCNEEGMASGITRLEHLGLMPPHGPAAAGKPVGDFRRDHCVAHDDRARGQATGSPLKCAKCLVRHVLRPRQKSVQQRKGRLTVLRVSLVS